MDFLFTYGSAAVAEGAEISIPTSAHTACDYRSDREPENFLRSDTWLDIPLRSYDTACGVRKKLDSVQSSSINALNYPALLRQFDALRSLSDGWYDGQGKALDAEALESLADWLLESFPPGLPTPAVVPTQEGNVLFEWDVPGEPSVDIRLSDLHAEFHSFLSDGTDLEREFDLDSDEERILFLSFLGTSVGGTRV